MKISAHPVSATDFFLISLFKYFSTEITSIDKACVWYVLLEKYEEKIWIRNRRGKKQGPVISELSCRYSVT